MAEKGKLAAIAHEKGMTTQQLVVDTFNRTKSMRKAARELDVTVTTISHHLRKAGFEPVMHTVLKRTVTA